MNIYLTSTASIEEVDAAIAQIPVVEGERAIGVRFPDGSYRVIGRIVRDYDCPPEDFDTAMELLALNPIFSIEL